MSHFVAIEPGILIGGGCEGKVRNWGQMTDCYEVAISVPIPCHSIKELTRIVFRLQKESCLLLVTLPWAIFFCHSTENGIINNYSVYLVCGMVEYVRTSIFNPENEETDLQESKILLF